MSSTFFTSEADAPAKQRILIEALDLFTRKGLCATSIRDIAAATGYTNPALYKHFASKDELALSLFVACYGELVRRLERALESGDDFASMLHAFVRAYLGLLDEHPAAVVFVQEHLQRFWPEAPPRLKRRTVPALIRRLALAARPRPGGPSEDARVLAATGALAQLSRMLYLGGVAAPASRWHADLVTVFERLLR